MIKAKKLIGGPGITGKMQPIRPHNAKSNPRIINMIVKVMCSSVYKNISFKVTTHVVRLKLFRLKAEGVRRARLPYFGENT